MPLAVSGSRRPRLGGVKVCPGWGSDVLVLGRVCGDWQISSDCWILWCNCGSSMQSCVRRANVVGDFRVRQFHVYSFGLVGTFLIGASQFSAHPCVSPGERSIPNASLRVPIAFVAFGVELVCFIRGLPFESPGSVVVRRLASQRVKFLIGT